MTCSHGKWKDHREVDVHVVPTSAEDGVLEQNVRVAALEYRKAAGPAAESGPLHLARTSA